MYELIEQKVLDADAASITFSNIPQIFTDLLVVLSARSGRSNTNEAMRLSFNGSTAGFSDRYMDGTGSSVASGTGSRYAGQAVSTTATSNTFSNVEIYIPNYAGSANKSYSVNSVTENNATYAVQGIVAGLWSNTAAITSIAFTTDFANNFLQYTTATLYGVGRKQGIGLSGGFPKATGGQIALRNGYWVHTFNASDTFTPIEDMEAEYLVIAGGGSGGYDRGSGGGAGGYRSSISGESSGGGASAESPLSLTANTNYSVVVGAGGAAQTAYGQFTNVGTDSTFATITSTGGGAGKQGSGGAGVDGGSGSGGASALGVNLGGAGVSGQGFAGGNSGAGTGGAGGGGGAGSVGEAGVGNCGQAGAGGPGVASNVTGSLVYRAGGGGGGAAMDFSAPRGGGAGGIGGGAAGGNTNGADGGAGTANTGGGGGGGANISQGDGGAGGSGIVIVRYKA